MTEVCPFVSRGVCVHTKPPRAVVAFDGRSLHTRSHKLLEMVDRYMSAHTVFLFIVLSAAAPPTRLCNTLPWGALSATLNLLNSRKRALYFRLEWYVVLTGGLIDYCIHENSDL